MRARILNASAGSGKTYQLAYKYVRDVVEQPGIYRHILAVTFTLCTAGGCENQHHGAQNHLLHTL